MELKKDNNDNQRYAYQDDSRQNPNEALFGGMGGSAPYSVTSSYSADNYSQYKKSNTSNFIIVAIVLVIVIIAGGFVYGEYKKANRYNGKYVLTASEVYGVTYDIEDLERTTGMKFDAELEINGKRGYLKIDSTSTKREGNVSVEIDGNTIILGDQTNNIKGVYDTSDDTISINVAGVVLIFEKVD